MLNLVFNFVFSKKKEWTCITFKINGPYIYFTLNFKKIKTSLSTIRLISKTAFENVFSFRTCICKESSS